jgi:hypothetical protein
MATEQPPTNLKILCPYCDQAWDAEMEGKLESISAGCDTCGFGAEASVRFEIRCSNCHRIVYVKEGTYE